MIESGVLTPAVYCGAERRPRFGSPSGESAALVTLFEKLAPNGTELDCEPTQS